MTVRHSLFLVCMLALLAGAPVFADPPIVGVGMVVGRGPADTALRVMQVLPNTPAAAGGVVADILINKIDDAPTAVLSVEDCVGLLRGPEGTTVRLELLDPVSNTTRTIVLTRAPIQRP